MRASLVLPETKSGFVNPFSASPTTTANPFSLAVDTVNKLPHQESGEQTRHSTLTNKP